MDGSQYIYTPDTLISKHTNKPVGNCNSNPVFWCATCQLKFTDPLVAIQHLNARSHKAKSSLINILKRGIKTWPSCEPVTEPESKKIKEESVGLS